MKIKLVLLFGLMLTMCHLGIAQEAKWFSKIKSVNLLNSTREDLTKLFGEPKKSASVYFTSYELNEGEMNVEYSRGLCSNEKKEGWNVPEFVVTRIFFTPKIPITLKKLGVNLSDFSKYDSDDVPGAFTYENKKSGVSYDLKRNGKIETIEFYPPKKFDYLRCEK